MLIACVRTHNGDTYFRLKWGSDVATECEPTVNNLLPPDVQVVPTAPEVECFTYPFNKGKAFLPRD